MTALYRGDWSTDCGNDCHGLKGTARAAPSTATATTPPRGTDMSTEPMMIYDAPMGGAVMMMSWLHPRHGRIREAVCAEHESAVLATVKTLGIGCIGQGMAPGLLLCGRCVAAGDGQSPREYVAGQASVAASTVPAVPDEEARS